MNKHKIYKYLPLASYEAVYDIDFKELYAQGRRIMLLDIDNTLLPYDMLDPTDQLIKWINEVKDTGFLVILISNNNKKRVKRVADALAVDGIWRAVKPFACSYKRILKAYRSSPKEIIAVGDQILTDVKGAKKCNIDCITVKPLKRSNEKWYTKLNRIKEQKILNAIDQYNADLAKKENGKI